MTDFYDATRLTDEELERLRLRLSEEIDENITLRLLPWS
jgi:hypothetical protein